MALCMERGRFRLIPMFSPSFSDHRVAARRRCLSCTGCLQSRHQAIWVVRIRDEIAAAKPGAYHTPFGASLAPPQEYPGYLNSAHRHKGEVLPALERGRQRRVVGRSHH
jgi:hypothetical protein